MFDQTALSVLLFTFLKLALWIGIILYTIVIVHRIVAGMDKITGEEIGQAIHMHLKSVIIWAVVFVAVVVITGIETAYRPKTIVAPRNEYMERMRSQEKQPLPSVKAAPTRPSWEEVEKKNKAENEAARREFESLPE